MLIAGLKVVVVPTPKEVKRTPWERLTERPWRPMKRYKYVEHPVWGALQDGNSFLTMHDRIFMTEAQLRRLEERIM